MQSSFSLVPLLLLLTWATVQTSTAFSVPPSTGRPSDTHVRVRSSLLPIPMNNDGGAEAETESILLMDNDGVEADEADINAELESLGWKPHFAAQLNQHTQTSMDEQTNIKYVPARITEILSHRLVVRGANRMEHTLPRTSTTRDVDVAVGDWVLLDKADLDARILVVLERSNSLQRLAPGRSSRKIQLLAANVDTVFVVSSCNQDFNAARLERYIAMVLNTANTANINSDGDANSPNTGRSIIPMQPVIVLTKRDLWDVMEDDDDDFDGAAALDIYVQQAESIAIGISGDTDSDTDTESDQKRKIPVVVLDARYEEPLQQLKEWCQPGQTVAFVGSSGVGKSTLVNALMGDTVAETADIHLDSGQGRHTTTTRQLHFIRNNGCAILDSPGLRELQLVEASHGVDLVFGDLVALASKCRFKDCRHEMEPGCAIQAALEEGSIDDERVARWEKLVVEDQVNSKGMQEAARMKESKQLSNTIRKKRDRRKTKRINYSDE
jgi:ribosome biogenesis GTPase